MSADRTAAIDDFLRAEGWADARRYPLAGDASARRYDRLTEGPDGMGAVLMDAAPETGGDVAPFLRIARHLAGLGLSPPAILAADPTRGLLLLEDLGDTLFARLATDDPGSETDLYVAAVDALIALHRHPVPTGLPVYSPASLARQASLAWQWYRGAPDTGDDDKMTEALTELGTILAGHDPVPPVLILRDFHAENLIWRPERIGVARIGLLDFQDAGAGHPAYDLVSLLEDARRDVASGLADRLTDHYLNRTGHDPARFREAAAALAAQRNLRILGVFARLARLHHKPAYIGLIPRVWGHLMHDLSHPRLASLRQMVLASLPVPEPAHLNRLRTPCPTPPTP